MKEFINKLQNHIPSEILRLNEPMSEHTTFKIGGPADVFCMPQTKEQLQTILQACRENSVEFHVVGNGSNLLVSDSGIRGAVIQIGKNMSAIKVAGNIICAEGGALMSTVANAALKQSLTGLEFASGIPGTMGGGACMNAGAYDGELKDVITAVTALDCSGNIIKLLKEDLQFGYRSSIIQKENLVVLDVTMALRGGEKDAIKAKMQDFNARRKDKQPLELPSAGSTFKRPPNNFAGKLIMDAQLAGFTIGDAAVSTKHCGFIVNIGNATCEDVLALIKHIQVVVADKFGVILESEVKIIGEQ